MNIYITGTGKGLPEQVISNHDLEKIVDTNDEWIKTRTGIKERRISTGENTSDLAVKAAGNALKEAGLNASDLDLIIVATFSPDAFMPSTACIVQEKIRAIRATAFDISAACTGFIFALDTASQMLKSERFNRALVVGAEVLSKIVDWTDRNTCVLFGDGAGAAILEKKEEESPVSKGVIDFYTGSDGRGGPELYSKAVPVNNHWTQANQQINYFMYMNGKEIFKFAVNILIQSIQTILEKNGLKIEDIDHIIPHQANYRIIDSTAKRMNIPTDKFYLNMDKYGNTSAASIPMALDDMNKMNLLKPGEKCLMIGFGGGLTWGSALIEWSK